MAATKKTRFQVFKRDEFTCQYCGRQPPQVVLECDHVIPTSKGGTDDMANLVTSCFDCNRGKADDFLSDVPPKTAETLAREQELEDQVVALEAFLKRKRQRIASKVRRLAKYWTEHLETTLEQPGMRSLKLFSSRMTEAQILDAIDATALRCPGGDERSFTYFCGVCWNMIRAARK